MLLNPPAVNGRVYVRDAYCSGISKGRYCWPPLDLMMISGTLARHHEVTVLDAHPQGYGPDRARRLIKQEAPDALVFLISSGSRADDLPFISRIKKALPDIKLVMIGDLAVTRPAELLADNEFIDGAIQNYLDPEIADGFTKDGLRPVRNLVCRTAERIVAKDRVTLKDATIPPPRHDLFPLECYQAPWARKKLLTSTTTSDGCPFACSFCTVGLLDYVARPVEDVLVEIKLAKKASAQEIYFQDFLFTAHKKRTLDLCQRLIQEQVNISWCCLSKVNTFDEQVLKAMKRAGCHTIQLGLESGNNQILSEMGKGFTTQDVRRAVRQCSKAGIRTDAIFMIGYPGETEADIRNTVDLALGLPLHLATFVIVTPNYGVRMIDEVLAKGRNIDLNKPYDDADNVLSVSVLSADRLKYLRAQVDRRFFFRTSQIFKLLFGLRTLTELSFLFREGVYFVRDWLHDTLARWFGRGIRG